MSSQSPSPHEISAAVRIEHLQKAKVLRRLLALLLFVAALVAFRHLALLGVTFVIFSRAFGALGARLAQAFPRRLTERRGVALVLLMFVLLLAGVIWAAVLAGVRQWSSFRMLHDGEPLTQVMTQTFTELQEDLMRRLPAWVPLDDLKDKAPELAAPAMTYLRATGRMLLELLIGLILAVIYLLDRAPVDQLLKGIRTETVPGHLKRYFGYLAEAILITISLQVLVALVNTALTLPVIWGLRLPHLSAFTAVIFFSSLVPVVGNLVSGAVLIIASYVYKGVVAVLLFVGTTFLLHKVEAYYLNPRLAARHVNLPSLVLIISLILFEHVFGLVGLFLSFPGLYIGLKIWGDLRAAMAEKERDSVRVAQVLAEAAEAEATADTAADDDSASTPLPPPLPAASGRSPEQASGGNLPNVPTPIATRELSGRVKAPAQSKPGKPGRRRR